MPDLDVTLAGAVSLRRGDRRVGERAFGARQLRLVTALLVLERDGPVSMDLLAGQLWPDRPPTQWKVAVRGLVSQFRRRLVDLGLGTDAVVGDQGRYVVDLGDVRVDLEAASHDVADGRRAVDAGAIDRATLLAGSARSVLSRPVLSGVESEWLDRLRDSVARDHLESLILLGECRRRLGAPADARRVLAEAITIDPLREDAWRAAMRAEAAAGNVARALAAYEDCRRRLADDLGVDPAEETQQLHAELLQAVPDADALVVPRAPAADVAGTTATRDLVPYVGLRSFTMAEADRFFGRDAEVQALVDRLARHGIVAVVGPSGVGKSSLVRAGLLPALEHGAIPDADTWLPVVMTPTAAPGKALAAELAQARPGVDQAAVRDAVVSGSDGLHDAAGLVLADAPSTARVLLVVDQFEELFTLGSADRAEAFVGLLTAATGRLDRRVVVAVTLRADFYDRAADVAGMADLLSHSQFVVPPLEGDQVEAAITGPARRVGVSLEPGLLGRIVADVAGEPGSLPLLQHLLYELWQHRVDRVLTRGAHDDLGGVSGALAHRAEQVYVGLGREERAVARRILLRAVQPGEEGGDARRPVIEDELHGPGDDRATVDRVVERLVDARLLTAGQETPGTGRTLEIAHEALIDGWPRLRGWVDEARGWLLDHRRLTFAAQEWVLHDRQDDWLLAGTPLDEAHELVLADGRGDVDLHLSPGEHELVRASLDARELVRNWEAERLQRRRDLERRSSRRLRGLVAAMAVGTLVAGALWVSASRRAEVAAVLELAAESTAALDRDPSLALLLALEAYEGVVSGPPMETHAVESALHGAIASQRLVRHHPESGLLLDVSPGRGIYVTARDARGSGGVGVIDVHDAKTGDVLRTFEEDGEGVASAALSDDGRLLVAGGRGEVLHLWDVSTGELVQTFRAPPGVDQLDVDDVHPDATLVSGRQLADAERGRTFVWDVETGEVVADIPRGETDQEGGPDGPAGSAFSPDGKRLAIFPWWAPAEVVVVEVATWDPVWTQEYDFTIAHGAWSPDGAWLAFGTERVFVVDADTGAVEREVSQVNGAVGRHGLDWSGDSERLVVGTGTIQVWRPFDVLTEPDLLVTGDLGSNNNVFMSPDDGLLYTGSPGGSGVHVWDVSADAGTEVAWMPAVGMSAMLFSPGGDELVVADHEGVVTSWDTRTWTPERLLEVGGDGVHDLEWSVDQTRLAVAGPHRVAVWDVDAGRITLEPWASPPGVEPTWTTVARLPDEDVFALSGYGWDGDWLRVVDEDGTVVSDLPVEPGESIERIEFSPDGELLAVARFTGPLPLAVHGFGIDLWDWRAGRRVRTLDADAFGVAWHPDGGRLVTASHSGTPQVFDVASGEVVMELDGHTNSNWAVTYSPDGELIATGGDDGTVRVWDADTGAELQRFVTQPEYISQLAFSPDAGLLAMAHATRGVYVWTLDLDDLAELARSRSLRNFTRGECRRHLGLDECPA